MEFTTEEKSTSQIEDEKVLIAQQEAYDTAVKEKDNKKAEKIRLQSKSEKRFFGSLEFEVELKRLHKKQSQAQPQDTVPMTKTITSWI